MHAILSQNEVGPGPGVSHPRKNLILTLLPLSNRGRLGRDKFSIFPVAGCFTQLSGISSFSCLTLLPSRGPHPQIRQAGSLVSGSVGLPIISPCVTVTH